MRCVPAIYGMDPGCCGRRRPAGTGPPPSRARRRMSCRRSARPRSPLRWPGFERNGSDTEMNPEKRAEIYRRLKAANPKPTTELNYQTPYELLVSVSLSAQATDKSVNAATERLFPVANTPAAILKLGEAGLKPYIKTIGLFNTKARNIVAAAKMLLELHGGEVPRDREALEALPGVGRKTANVVLNTAFGEP